MRPRRTNACPTLPRRSRPRAGQVVRRPRRTEPAPTDGRAPCFAANSAGRLADRPAQPPQGAWLLLPAALAAGQRPTGRFPCSRVVPSPAPAGGLVVVARSFSCRATPHRAAPRRGACPDQPCGRRAAGRGGHAWRCGSIPESEIPHCVRDDKGEVGQAAPATHPGGPPARWCGGLAGRSRLPQTVARRLPGGSPAGWITPSPAPAGGLVVVARSFSCRATPHRAVPL